MENGLRIAVIGAGQMGAGFAVHFRLTGQRVTLIDHRQSNLEESRQRIRETVRFLNEQGVMSVSPATVLAGIEFTLDLPSGCEDAEIVLETVSEDLAVKREVFRELGAATSSETILATNTSSIPITDIAEGMPFADRVVGCHWLYPPYLLPTVEVIAGRETADEVIDQLNAFLEAVDRKPIVVHRDIPGFVWNRVQFAVLRECIHLLREGIASAEDINTAIRDGYARRTAVIGPFETVDLAGVDLFETVATQLYPSLADRDSPSDLFEQYRYSGRLGVESGEGFFRYDDDADEVARRRDDHLIEIAAALEERNDL